jgi:outer membrane murein-binding lipoprotein Lpp
MRLFHAGFICALLLVAGCVSRGAYLQKESEVVLLGEKLGDLERHLKLVELENEALHKAVDELSARVKKKAGK